MAFSICPSLSPVNYTQGEAQVIFYLHVNDIQGTLRDFYKMASKELNYNMDGINVNAQVSNVNDHSVYVNFYITYNNIIIHSSSTIIDNNGKYLAVAGIGQSSNLHMKNEVIWDPGGTYYYYVTGNSGSGSQTWSYWYSPGSSWSSIADAYPSTGTFFVTWNGPLIALIFGIPAVFSGFSWEASNGSGWHYSSQLFISHSEGSATVQSYYGIYTTVSVTVGWIYSVGIF